MARPTSSPEPAASAAGASTANTPAPTIDPRPMTTASKTPRRRSSRVGGVPGASDDDVKPLVVLHELHLEPARLLEVRRRHAGEVPPMGRVDRLHAGGHEL